MNKNYKSVLKLIGLQGIRKEALEYLVGDGSLRFYTELTGSAIVALPSKFSDKKPLAIAHCEVVSKIAELTQDDAIKILKQDKAETFTLSIDVGSIINWTPKNPFPDISLRNHFSGWSTVSQETVADRSLLIFINPKVESNPLKAASKIFDHNKHLYSSDESREQVSSLIDAFSKRMGSKSPNQAILNFQPIKLTLSDILVDSNQLKSLLDVPGEHSKSKATEEVEPSHIEALEAVSGITDSLNLLLLRVVISLEKPTLTAVWRELRKDVERKVREFDTEEIIIDISRHDLAWEESFDARNNIERESIKNRLTQVRKAKHKLSS